LITIGGILAILVSLFFKKIHFLASYFFLCPFFAAFFSFWLFWEGGLLVEHFFGETRWSSLSAVLGYTGGFLLGGFCGLFVAYKVNKIFFTQHGAVQRMRKKLRPGDLYRWQR
jgi:hypothetical protein